ncbi:IclR family transcriptional regulator [Streptomyces sp. 6N223]|uniref:IclR family transcriptional regulator n=1 Tax=Streptomyces sp. 6N223 TaxID=3457412 RepID=UPI003FD1379D
MSQSVDRAISIITLCAESPRGLRELADELDVHRSTVLRLLQTMEKRGFMRRDRDGTWALGLRLTGVAVSALEAIDTRTVAHPWLLRLARELGHTLHLAELQGSDVVYVDKVEGRGAMRMHSRIGLPVVIHTAAVAKALLAYLDPPGRNRIIAKATFQRFTGKTITSPTAYVKELEAARERHWAKDDGEYEEYINCVAVPIFDYTGAPRAAMSITALKAIEPMERLQLHIPLLQEAAADISLQMGSSRDRSEQDRKTP